MNYLNMEAYYIINFLFFNVICGKMSISENGLLFENKSNHLLKKGKDGDEYSKFIIKEYMSRIKIVNVNIYKNYGDEDNAMHTALISGFETVIFESIRSVLETKQSVVNCFNQMKPDFCKTKNMTSIYAVIKISIIDVIISLIKAKLRLRKLKCEEK